MNLEGGRKNYSASFLSFDKQYVFRSIEIRKDFVDPIGICVAND